MRRLKNTFYAGYYIWGDEECTGLHEIIIPPALYRRVQESFQQSGKSAEQKRHGAFSDFLRCGTDGCGCKITFQKKIKPSGRIYRLYSCANGKKVHKTLAGQYIREEEIMNQFEPA